MPTQEDVLREALRDAEIREERERTVLARAVATWVVKYRTERMLSQTKLAKLLGWRQPNVARLESGEHEPSLTALRLLAQELDIELVIDIAPADHGCMWPSNRPVDAAVFEHTTLADGTSVAFAARAAAERHDPNAQVGDY
jgi:ribosome-binding protein aMBF1 (putative translation factor)